MTARRTAAAMALLLAACAPRVEVGVGEEVARPMQPGEVMPALPDGGPDAPPGDRLGIAPLLGGGDAYELTYRSDGAWSCIAWDGANESCQDGPYVAAQDGTFLRSLGGHGDQRITCMEWVASADVRTIKVTTEDGTRWVLEPLERSLDLLGAHLFAACVPSQEFLRDHIVIGFDADGERIVAYPEDGIVR